MAFSQSDLDALEKAIATGVLTVRYADRSVTYQTLSDLMRARDLVKAELNVAAGTPRKRVIRVQQSGTGYQ